MEATARKIWTEDEYLAFEADSQEKHEFINGEIIAMAGGSEAHNTICMNIGSELRALVKAKGRPCRVLTSDQRVAIDDTGLYTYPDVTVVCGQRQAAAKSPSTLTNPLLLVEVLSEGTEGYDRGAKFAHYQRAPSLQSYLLVSQTSRRIEHYQRLPSGQWLLTVAEQGELELPCLGGALSVDEVYWHVELPEPTTDLAPGIFRLE